MPIIQRRILQQDYPNKKESLVFISPDFYFTGLSKATHGRYISPSAERPIRVFHFLVNSYLESVPRSHYGGKAVVQQMGIITLVIITVLPFSANF